MNQAVDGAEVDKHAKIQDFHYLSGDNLTLFDFLETLLQEFFLCRLR